jgi:hypothetical protein
MGKNSNDKRIVFMSSHYPELLKIGGIQPIHEPGYNLVQAVLANNPREAAGIFRPYFPYTTM